MTTKSFILIYKKTGYSVDVWPQIVRSLQDTEAPNLYFKQLVGGVTTRQVQEYGDLFEGNHT